MVAVDDDLVDEPLHDSDAPGPQRRGQPVVEGFGDVPEDHDVVRELPEEQGLVHRARRRGQDADRPVAHLPAVAVRAVQDVAAPARGARPGTSGSSSTRPVATSTRRARTTSPSSVVTTKPTSSSVRVHHASGDDLAAVRPQLVAATRQQLRRRHALADRAARAPRPRARCAAPPRPPPAPTVATGPASPRRSARRRRHRSPPRPRPAVRSSPTVHVVARRSATSVAELANWRP